MSKETVLITGASSGIGLHLAKECARHGHPLVLVAPGKAELHQVAFTLSSAHPLEVRTIAKDLREPDAAKEIFDELKGVQVDILINNAGHGKKGKLWEIPIEEDLSMLRLNIEAVVRMTKAFLPAMIARNRGRIMNTASVAGFEPGPGYTIYSSTKAFVLSFSESLATELKDSNITVTALCPGPTDTDFFRKADMMASRSFQQANLMAPQEVAKAAYKGLMAGDRLVTPGFGNKAMTFIRRFIPESMQATINDLLTADAPPAQQKRRRGDKELGYKE